MPFQRTYSESDASLFNWNLKLAVSYFIEDTVYHIYPIPPLRQDMTQGHFFKAEFNRFEFRVFLLLDQLPHQRWRNQSALLFTHSWRIIGFIPFQKVLVLCEMQSVLSRIWTRVAVSISYNDNHYTMGTSYHWRYCLCYFSYLTTLFRYFKNDNQSTELEAI